MNRRTIIIMSAAAVAVLAVGATAMVVATNPTSPVPAASGPADPGSSTTTPSTAVPDATWDTGASLLYMMEEEKLAHDVYVTLGDQWGANVFANISASETTHQELLLPLLEARGLTDPRSPEIGVFVNADLQALYDELVARGSASRAEAMQVGIAIEERDISDIGAAVAAEDEADVIAVYERLLAGSENHLVAFQRQV